MDCQKVQDNLGPLLDGELLAGARSQVKAHLATCPACAAELGHLRSLIADLEDLAARDKVHPPEELWGAIARRLSPPQRLTARPTFLRFFRRPLAAAASLMMLVGAGTFVAVWLTTTPQVANASTVDYSILLDNLAQGVDAAVNSFLDHYRADASTVAEAKASAPNLSFDLPAQLPSGHKLEQVYRLRFGDSPGVAARYRLGTEPLVVFFHPPVDREHLGVHREMPCIVGGRHGDRVKVGPWQLVHFTDPSTCHCVLSRLDSSNGLAKVLAAVVPQFEPETETVGPHSHQH